MAFIYVRNILFSLFLVASYHSKAQVLPVSINATNQIQKIDLFGLDGIKLKGFITTWSKASSCWVWYTPALSSSPDVADEWYFQQFKKNGITVAGINIGESFGSPRGLVGFQALYEYMVNLGYSSKPIFLARSRGGLQALTWANNNPDKVMSIVGIYPLFRLDDYLAGSAELAKPWGMPLEKFKENAKELSPIFRINSSFREKIGMFIIHGDRDMVVNYKLNALLMKKIYGDRSDLFKLITIKDAGHEVIPEFHRNKYLIKYIVDHCNN